MMIITNLGAIEHLIDGYVTTNDALCLMNSEVVVCHAIPEDAAIAITNDAITNNYGLIVIGQHDVAFYDPKGDVNRIFSQELTVQNLHLAKPLNEVLKQRNLQITAFFNA